MNKETHEVEVTKCTGCETDIDPESEVTIHDDNGDRFCNYKCKEAYWG
jgi:hypothetical protein